MVDVELELERVLAQLLEIRRLILDFTRQIAALPDDGGCLTVSAEEVQAARKVVDAEDGAW